MSASTAAKTGFSAAAGALMGGYAGSQIGLAMVPRREVRRSARDASERQVLGAVIGGTVGALVFGAGAGAYVRSGTSQQIGDPGVGRLPSGMGGGLFP